MARLLARIVEAGEESAGEVFLGGEYSHSLGGAVPDRGGVRAEKQRERRDDLAVDDGELDSDVMAAGAPRPGSVAGGIAEDGEVVAVGIAEEVADEVLDGLPFAKDDLVIDYLPGLLGGALAKSAGHQAQGGVALRPGHVPERQSVAHPQLAGERLDSREAVTVGLIGNGERDFAVGQEAPLVTLVAPEFVGGCPALCVVERVEESQGGVAHGAGGGRGVVGGGEFGGHSALLCHEDGGLRLAAN